MRKGIALLLAGLVLAGVAFAEPIRLTRITHVYGVLPAPNDPAKLLIATERGFFLAGPDGNADPVSVEGSPLLAFAARADGTLLATAGERQGTLFSRDGGKTWARFSPDGQPGPFLVIDAAPTNPLVAYGVAGGTVYRSGDGGRAWVEASPAPAPVVDIAIAAGTPAAVYLGTARGLFRSDDGGKTWAVAPMEGATRAASMAATLADGQTYAFLAGTGLVQLAADGKAWTVLSPPAAFDGALLHLAARKDGSLVAVTQYMKLVVSADRGKTWTPYNPPG